MSNQAVISYKSNGVGNTITFYLKEGHFETPYTSALALALMTGRTSEITLYPEYTLDYTQCAIFNNVVCSAENSTILFRGELYPVTPVYTVYAVSLGLSTDFFWSYFDAVCKFMELRNEGIDRGVITDISQNEFIVTWSYPHSREFQYHVELGQHSYTAKQFKRLFGDATPPDPMNYVNWINS